MSLTTSEQEERFLESLTEYNEAYSFVKPEKLEKLLSQLDGLFRSADGMPYVYERMPELLRADIFKGTAWVRPQRLVPALVSGTLLSGHPNSTLEVLSELRVLAVAEGRVEVENFPPERARQFLVDVLVAGFDLAFEDFSDNSWDIYAEGELRKIRNLLDFLLARIPIRHLKNKLEEESATLIAHRPINPRRLEKMLTVADRRIELDETDPEDRRLMETIEAYLRPTPLSRTYPDQAAYREALSALDFPEFEKECKRTGTAMEKTGLVSTYQFTLLKYAAEERPDAVPDILHLDAHGQAEYERHRTFVRMLISDMIVPAVRHSVHGLSKVLERNLFSRQITWNAFNRLLRVNIHPEIGELLQKSNHSAEPAEPIQLLIGGIISVLGHPLGVRQGNNPTCQSARGISMWSRHAPGKLINLLIDAATANNIALRYEGEVIESASASQGLIKQFDPKLDPVSVVLVPHLDKIYNAMMQRAPFKHHGKDPHVSVNPAFYGHWIQTGFLSVYNPIIAAIENFEEFVRTFYASFHPKWNGGHHLIYPVPLGIFITDANANMLGFHAVSLLRIELDPSDEWRAYFFNPNSEGRQFWGQGISPSVTGNDEEPGESSLPVFQFLSRVYAYHYNNLHLDDKPAQVPATVVQRVERLARLSWGRKYRWV